MQIRLARAADIPAVAKIYDAIHTQEEAGNVTVGWVRSVYPTEETARVALLRGDLFVLEETGVIQAAAIINFLQPDGYQRGAWLYPAKEDEVLVLHTLVVNPAIAGRGLGRRFVSFYEDLAVKKGRPFLRMDTNERNERARQLYASLGYREAGIVPTVFNGIPDVMLVLLEKKLESSSDGVQSDDIVSER